MKLSKTELLMLSEIADGNKKIEEIAKALKKSKSQIYRTGQKLKEKELVEASKGQYVPVKVTHVSLLLQIVGPSRFSKAVEPFCGSGIPMLAALIDPKTIKEIIKETGIKRAQIFKLLKIARGRSIIRKEGGRYYVNEKLYPDIKEFLEELRKYERCTDQRVPANAIIYFKSEKEIIFSSNDYLPAAITAFSAYKDHGIKLLNITNFYYLPKKKLGRKEIFKHSLYIAEKKKEIRYVIYIALFYAKYKKELSSINHPIIRTLNKIFAGQRIIGYPKKEEIKDRAEVYDIRL